MKLGLQLALLLAVSAPAPAAEVAVLRNGYTIRHEVRQEVGELTRLYLSTDRASFVDIPTADLDHFEHDDAPVFPASATEPPAPAPRANPVISGRTPKATQQEIADAIGSASSRYRLDPDFVASVVSAESNFNSRAVSPKGAQGLMQLMPGTASQLGIDNAFDPAKNTDGGTRYLRMLLERFNFDVAKALAAYNAGPLRVDQHNGVPPYKETRKYVTRIINDYNRKKLAQAKPTPTKPPQNVASAKTRTTPAKARTTSKPKPATVYQAETLHQQ